MPDVPVRPKPEEPEPAPTTAERVNKIAETVAPGVQPRRLVLFLVAMTGCALGPAWWVFGFAGLVAILILALTDQVWSS